MSNPQSSPSHSQSATVNSGPNVRLLLLLGALAIAISALLYDYTVARVKVDDAYNRIAKLNDDLNFSSEKRAMTSGDIQQTLGRKPDSLVDHSPYKVEEYGYRSGLLIPKHKYYAVYMEGAGKSEGKLLFVKQFKFVLPPEELTVAQPNLDDAGDSSAPEGMMSGAAPGAPPGGGTGPFPPGSSSSPHPPSAADDSANPADGSKDKENKPEETKKDTTDAAPAADAKADPAAPIQDAEKIGDVKKDEEKKDDAAPEKKDAPSDPPAAEAKPSTQSK